VRRRVEREGQNLRRCRSVRPISRRRCLWWSLFRRTSHWELEDFAIGSRNFANGCLLGLDRSRERAIEFGMKMVGDGLNAANPLHRGING
jgi:hypothetical protein